MGSLPINLFIRFVLEITALVFVGIWGWKQSDEWLRYLLTFGLPVLLAVVWGTFAVPDDPSRSGKAPIVVPGAVRLIIELAIFSFATWSVYDAGLKKTGVVIGIIIVLHYIVSYDRVLWLLSGKHKGRE